MEFRPYKLLFIFPIICLFPCFLFAEDKITIHILREFNKRDFKNINPISEIQFDGNGKIVKIWGYLKFESDTSYVKPETYYLEWSYFDGKSMSLLSNYKNNKYLEYKRKVEGVDDYYWVTKRIRTENIGDYYFRIYRKEKSKYILLNETKLIVGNGGLNHD